MLILKERIPSHNREHLTAIDKFHAQVDVAVVLHRICQMNHKLVFHSSQDFSFIGDVFQVLLLHNCVLFENFHRRNIVSFFMFCEFLSEGIESSTKLSFPANFPLTTTPKAPSPKTFENLNFVTSSFFTKVLSSYRDMNSSLSSINFNS